jgi:S1-C subfamily serine protease
VKYRELAVAIPSGSAFAGAGVFDMDGNLVGVVGRCRNEHVAIAARDVPSVLQTAVSVENLIPHRLGFLATPMKEREKEYFSVQSGLEVHTVRQHSLSDRAGLRPGDVIVAVADQEITSAHDLAPLLESAPPSLTIVRNGVKSKLTIPSPEETVSDAGDLGLDATALPTARTIVTVRPGSPAYEAGLRTGDVIVRIGLRVNPSAIEIRRLLARRNGQPTFVVYERGMERTGVLVSK